MDLLDHDKDNLEVYMTLSTNICQIKASGTLIVALANLRYHRGYGVSWYMLIIRFKLLCHKCPRHITH